MKPAHFLAGIVGVACGLVGLVVAVIGHDSSPTLALMLFLGLAWGQLALLATWCVRGNAPWLCRWAATICTAALLSGPMCSATAGSWSAWFAVCCLFTALVAFSIRLAGWLGVSVLDGPTTGRSTPAPRHHPFQFSLCDLLSVITAIGLLLGLSRLVSFPWLQAREVTSYVVWLTAVAITTFWALTATRGTVIRFVLLSALCLVSGAMMGKTGQVHNAGFFMMVALIEAVVICLGRSATEEMVADRVARADA